MPICRHWPLAGIDQVYPRRFLLRRSAIEIFMRELVPKIESFLGIRFVLETDYICHFLIRSRFRCSGTTHFLHLHRPPGAAGRAGRGGGSLRRGWALPHVEEFFKVCASHRR